MRYIITLVALLVLTISAYAGSSVTLAWDPNKEKDLEGYKLYYGTETGNYGSTIDVLNVTEYTVENLVDGTYFFVVTAYDISNESGFSNEVNALLKDEKPPGNPKGLIIKVIIQVGVSEN